MENKNKVIEISAYHLIERIKGHFKPKDVEIVLHDDFSGFHYIKVDNSDNTFRAYGFFDSMEIPNLLSVIFEVQIRPCLKQNHANLARMIEMKAS